MTYKFEPIYLDETADHDIKRAKAAWPIILGKFAELRGAASKLEGFYLQDVTSQTRLEFTGFGRRVILSIQCLAEAGAQIAGHVICSVQNLHEAEDSNQSVYLTFPIDELGRTNFVGAKANILSVNQVTAELILAHVLAAALAVPPLISTNPLHPGAGSTTGHPTDSPP